MKRLLPLLLAGTACFDTYIDYVGKRCSATRPCPDALTCDAVSQTCRVPGSTTCQTMEPQLCALHDVELAPGATPAASDLMGGTRFVLQNADYGALRLSGSGTAGCPIVLAGPARFTDTLTLNGSHIIVTDITFEVPSKLYALTTTASASDLTLKRLHFSKTATSRAPMTEFPFDIFLEYNCADVTVTESEFIGIRAPGFFGAPTCRNVTVRGNRFVTGNEGPTIQIEGQEALIEGNDISGSMDTSAVQFVNGGTGIVRRNWFHDLTSNGLIAVRGAAEVTSNTFTNVPTAASCGAFRNNLVQHATNGVTCTTADRAYNLYDDVASPGMLATTDRSVSVTLDADGVPSAGSTAIDTADPALPVPEGGGMRADIGAFERGATRRSDGTYCTK